LAEQLEALGDERTLQDRAVPGDDERVQAGTALHLRVELGWVEQGVPGRCQTPSRLTDSRQKPASRSSAH
jgi:hypothetical protein